MNLVDTSMILIAALFAIYGLASAVEYGIMFKMLGRDEPSRAMFTPLWEVTNVFLVFGFTGLAILFNGALSNLSHQLMGTIGAAIILMLVRACLALSIFYIKTHASVPRWQLWLFAATTFLVPLSFASAGIYLLSGQLFWHTLLGWNLMLAAVAGLSGVGLLIMNRRANLRQRLAGQLAFCVWLLLLGSVLPLVWQHSRANLVLWPLLGLTGLSLLGLGLLGIDLAGRTLVKLWQYAAAVCLATPILLALTNRPYLIAGKLTLASAWGAQTYGSAIVIGLAVMLPLLALGGWLFIKLLSPVKK